MLQTADVCIVMSQDSFEVIRRPEDSFLMFSNRPRDKGWGKVYSSSIVSKRATGGKWIFLMCTKVMFTCLLEVTLMRGICYSTTLHQRKIKFQIFTSENFVLAGRMCSDISIHCVLASIIDVYYVWNVSAKSKQCLFYGNQLRLIVYNDAAIITIASSYDIWYKRAHKWWFSSQVRSQLLSLVNMETPATDGEGSADVGATDVDSHY